MLYEVTGYARLTGNGPDHVLPGVVVTADSRRDALRAWTEKIMASGYPRAFIYPSTVRKIG